MLTIRINRFRLYTGLAGAIACGLYVGNVASSARHSIAAPAAMVAPIAAPVPLPIPRPKNLGVRTRVQSNGVLPSHLKPIFAQSAKQVSLSPALVAAVAFQESRFDAGVCSAANACGIMQFTPGAAKDYKVARHNAASSIRGGARYLADLSKRYEGNTGLALAAYNWGAGNVDKWRKAGARADKMPKETRDYVRQITGKDIDVWTGKTRTVSQLLANLNPSDHVQKMMEIFKR